MADGIGTEAEDEDREVVLEGELIGFGDFFGAFYFDDVLGGAAKAHGGKA